MKAEFLDPNHSHFLLIDSGKNQENVFSSEMNWRNKFEMFLHEHLLNISEKQNYNMNSLHTHGVV